MLQDSYIWIRVCTALWPPVFVISLIRAIFMIFELQRGQFLNPSTSLSPVTKIVPTNSKDNLAWECANNGQLFGATPLQLETQTVTMPAGLCIAPFQNIFTAFTISLL